MDQAQICPACKTPTVSTSFFCPNCGKKLQERSLSTSFLKQFLIYSVSFFLPPFGLVYVFPYLKQPNEKAKIIGIIALVLTVLSFLITILVVVNALSVYNTLLNALPSGSSTLNSDFRVN